ncbi:MAG: pyridoxamine 5'-phosphate oxidase family protein [Solirubrobacteraceae bacterium]
MSRRDAIKMSAGEADAFLDEARTVTCATNGRSGFPHLMPLWYVLRDTQPTSSAGTGGQKRLWAWTYGKSQKTKNLERDPRATLQVEAGLAYEELRGIMLRCEVVVHRELEVVEGIAMELVDRYSGPGPEFDPVREGFRQQAPKRVGLEFVEQARVTWDHRKLGGAY